MRVVATQAVEVAAALGDELLMGQVLGRLGLALSSHSDTEAALETLEKAISISERYRDYDTLSRSLSNAAQIYLSLGEPTKGLQYLQRSAKFSSDLGTSGSVAFARNNVAVEAFIRGDWVEARRLYEEAERLSGSARLSRGRLESEVSLIVMDIYQTGDLSAGLSRLQELAATGAEIGNRQLYGVACVWQAWFLLHAGQGPRALEVLRPLMDDSVALEGVGHNLLAWAIHAGGDSDAALASLEARVRGNVGPFDASIARSVQGRIYYDLGRLDEAEKALKASIDLLRPMGEVPMFQAVILERLGSVYADQGDPVRAREALEATLPLFEKLGAAPSVRRVRAEISGLEQPGVTRETPSRTAR